MYRVRSAVAAFLLISARIVSQDLLVCYTEGAIQVLPAGEGTWRKLDVGVALSRDALVRVSDGGRVEMTNASSTIAIARDGTYAFDFLGEIGHGPFRIVDVVIQKIGDLTVERVTLTTASGVRGIRLEPHVNSDGPVWSDPEKDIYVRP